MDPAREEAEQLAAGSRGCVQDLLRSGQAPPRRGRLGRQEVQEEEIARLVIAQPWENTSNPYPQCGGTVRS